MMAAAPTIVQIDLPEPMPPPKRTWRQQIARGAIAVLIIVSFVAIFILATMTPWLCFSITFITLFGAPTAIVVIMLRRAHRIRRMLRTLPTPGSSAADLATAFHTWRDVPNEGAMLRKVVRELVRRGHRNLIIIAKYPDFQPDLTPLEIPFEPIDINRLHETIGSLTDPEDDTEQPTKPTPPTPALPPVTLRQRILGFFQTALGIIIVLLIVIGLPAFAAFTIIRGIVRTIQTGQPDTCLLVSVGALASVALIVGTRRFFRNSHTLLAPSAIILQRGRWYRSHHELHVLVPEDSVFLALMHPFGPPDEFDDEDETTYMSWWASDGDELACGFTDTLLLRAWLSPLPPPTLDQLTDFI